MNTMQTPIPAKSICAMVLAGGQGMRMGGIDKGLQHFHGESLAAHAVHRLKAQTLGPPGLIAINANRNLQDYAKWGYPVWPDLQTDFAGPLAGFQTALQHCQECPEQCDFLLVVPCDSPLFPLDLLERLAWGLAQANTDIAVATIPEVNRHGLLAMRAQPVFCLMRTTLKNSLNEFMAAGGRKINAWTDMHHTAEVPFDTEHDAPNAFFNANTLEQLQQLEQK
jgi:molybdopterin-guanine dinucleotide biosynthesis protein A